MFDMTTAAHQHFNKLIDRAGDDPAGRLSAHGVDVEALLEQGMAAALDMALNGKGNDPLETLSMFMAGASLGFELGLDAAAVNGTADAA